MGRVIKRSTRSGVIPGKLAEIANSVSAETIILKGLETFREYGIENFLKTGGFRVERAARQKDRFFPADLGIGEVHAGMSARKIPLLVRRVAKSKPAGKA